MADERFTSRSTTAERVKLGLAAALTVASLIIGLRGPGDAAPTNVADGVVAGGAARAEAALPMAEIDRPFAIDALAEGGALTYVGPPPDWSTASLAALFVLNVTLCPPCLNEVAEWGALLDEARAAGLAIEPLAVVFEDDAARARNFIRAVALPMPTAHGDDPTLAARLGVQHLVFADLERGRLFYRVALPNGKTPASVKRDALRTVLDARSTNHP